ncbi:hypothetical protein ACHAWC_008909 [Mediolabrus comicus]
MVTKTARTFFIFLLPVAVVGFFTVRRNTSSDISIIKRLGGSNVDVSTSSLSVSLPNFFGNKDSDSTAATTMNDELMQRTAKMMEDHRRSQEAVERTSEMMQELASTMVIGESKQGPNRKKGSVKVTFNGHRCPMSVEVDPNFLVSSSSGVISTSELNSAITEAMQDAFRQSGSVMEKRMTQLYEQLGLPKEPLSLDSNRDDQK